MLYWQASFLRHNPGIDYRFYDDSDNRSLIEEVLPGLLPFYDSLPREIFRVDFVRPVYMLKHGGFYADMDFQCLAPLARIGAARADVLLGKMGSNDAFPHCLPNAFLASRPNQGFWLGYLALIEEAWAELKAREDIADKPEFVTGPVVLRKAARHYLTDRAGFRDKVMDFIERNDLSVDKAALEFGRLSILPSHILYPINWFDQIHARFLRQIKGPGGQIRLEDAEARELFPGSVAVTFWTRSWGPKRRK
jgi:mannosyltransferase OCH1-like enzyme